MSDILIRDVPDAAVAEIDRRAHDMGISRNEYLRRWISRDFRPVEPVTPADLGRLSRLARDLGDPDIMREAWS